MPGVPNENTWPSGPSVSQRSMSASVNSANVFSWLRTQMPAPAKSSSHRSSLQKREPLSLSHSVGCTPAEYASVVHVAVTAPMVTGPHHMTVPSPSAISAPASFAILMPSPARQSMPSAWMLAFFVSDTA